MAITLDGKIHIPENREKVWQHLNDVETLRKAIPGCEMLQREPDGAMTATVKIKIGPISAKFNGAVTFSNIEPPSGYRITGEGQGGIAGFAKGAADVTLAEEGEGTLLTYVVEVNMGGRIAQLGQRLIVGTARKLSDQFFTDFAKAMEG